MHGLAGWAVMIGIVVLACIGIAVAIILIDLDATAARVDRPACPAPPARPHGPQTCDQSDAWTIGRAGLVGASAWLTAPRETDAFVARRLAILGAYQLADQPAQTMLAAAGWITERASA